MRCLVIHPDIRSAPRRRAAGPALDEAVSLARALDLEIAGSEIVRLASVSAHALFGRGTVAGLEARIEAEDIGLVIVDGPVSPVQQRNLERRWNTKVLDRTGLILEIFADRAATREGVLQVDLAALTYQRSRLVRSWTHLERQRGGLSFVGGAGETQIEADRRQIDAAILRLRRQLDKVVKTRQLHRKARRKVPYPVVALVGYTNAGKSTLFNRLTGAAAMARDMLFATLDPKMRLLDLPGGQAAILSDTVGFISDLPTALVAAFRATLEEVREADLIVHVRDITHAQSEAQAADVMEVLGEIGLGPDRAPPMIEVWNKIDRLDAKAAAACRATAARREDAIAASATSGEGVEAILAAIGRVIGGARHRRELRLGFAEGRRRAWLYEHGLVESERRDDEGYVLSIRWSDEQERRFAALGG